MADSVNNKRTEQSYLRQVQQEKALKKRELIENQTRDIKAVREHYSQEMKQLDDDAKSAILQIKEEGRRMAQQEKEERTQRIQIDQQEKLAERERKTEEFRRQSSSNSKVSSKLNNPGYNRQAQKTVVPSNTVSEKIVTNNDNVKRSSIDFSEFNTGSGPEDEAGA